MERTASLLPDEVGRPTSPDLFIAALGDQARHWARPLVLALRSEGHRVETDYDDASLKSQLRRADKLGTRWVCIVGEDELQANQIVLKDLQAKTQQSVPADRCLAELRRRLTTRAAGGT
jgi:histidyl-tRNA synthetase